MDFKLTAEEEAFRDEVRDFISNTEPNQEEEDHHLLALDDLDTRALVLRLRDGGAMRAAAVADAEGAGRSTEALEQVRRAAGDGGPGAGGRRLDASSAGVVQRGRPGARGGRRLRREDARSCAGCGRRGRR